MPFQYLCGSSMAIRHYVLQIYKIKLKGEPLGCPFSAKQNMDVSMSETICLISALGSIVGTAAYLLLPRRKDIGNLLL